METGSRLRIPGSGEAGGPGEPDGDLFVVLHVKQHPSYTRDGPDLMMEFPISFAQAALGAEVEIPTLEKKAKMTIPPGTQPETVFRLRGSGMPTLHGGSRPERELRGFRT